MLALSIQVEFWKHILFHHSFSQACFQSAETTKWLEFPFMFQHLRHRSLFVGDKANCYYKAFLRSISETWYLLMKNWLDNKISELFTKMYLCDWERKSVHSSPPPTSISSGIFFSWIYRYFHIHTLIQTISY
jgi:hypothetical protein